MADPTTVDGRPIEGGSAKPVAVMNPISVTLTGTIPGTVEIANDSGNPVPVSGTVDTELPAAAALTDATANPTAPAVASYGHGFNGTTWDRLRTAIGDAMAATGLLGFVQMLWNGATFDRWKGDNTGAARVSLYGKATAAGDTPLLTNANGAMVAGVAVVSSGSDGSSNSSLAGLRDTGENARFLKSAPSLFNEATWDRARNNTEVTVLASAARTASINSADLVNYNARGMNLVFDITVVPGIETLTLTIQGKSTLSGKYYTILAGAVQVGVATVVMRVYPGLIAAANLDANAILPRIWRVSVVASAGGSFTYSVDANYVL